VAVHELHREEPQPVLDEELAQADEVGMRQVLQRPELALEARDGIRMGRANRLERDLAQKLAIERALHDPHAAHAQARHHLKAPSPREALLVHARS
jgi:hypothetical protein